MKEIRNRIISVQKTMKITNAMYLMASSKMSRARKRLIACTSYFERLQETIADILEHTHMTELEIPYFFEGREVSPEGIRAGYIVITSDRGLAGSYNLNVIRLTEASLANNPRNTLFFIGSTGHSYFRRKPQAADIDEEYSFSGVNPTLFRARAIAEHVVDEYLAGRLDELHIVFTKMINALNVETKIIQVLPLTRDMFGLTGVKQEGSSYDYEEFYDPSPQVVLDHMIPNYVKGLLYGAMIEAYASEQNARMTAMDNATKNAGELSDKLTMLYNRVRQSAITTELAEVIGGAADGASLGGTHAKR